MSLRKPNTKNPIASLVGTRPSGILGLGGGGEMMEAFHLQEEAAKKREIEEKLKKLEAELRQKKKTIADLSRNSEIEKEKADHSLREMAARLTEREEQWEKQGGDTLKDMRSALEIKNSTIAELERRLSTITETLKELQAVPQGLRVAKATATPEGQRMTPSQKSSKGFEVNQEVLYTLEPPEVVQVKVVKVNRDASPVYYTITYEGGDPTGRDVEASSLKGLDGNSYELFKKGGEALYTMVAKKAKVIKVLDSGTKYEIELSTGTRIVDASTLQETGLPDSTEAETGPNKRDKKPTASTIIDELIHAMLDMMGPGGNKRVLLKIPLEEWYESDHCKKYNEVIKSAMEAVVLADLLSVKENPIRHWPTGFVRVLRTEQEGGGWPVSILSSDSLRKYEEKDLYFIYGRLFGQKDSQ